MPKFVLLWTDAAMWLLAFALLAYTMMVLRRPGLSASWKKVFADKAALASSVILLLCLALTLLDSIHYRPLLPPAPADYAQAVEATPWGPAHRLRPPLAIDGVRVVADHPAAELGSSPATWSGCPDRALSARPR